MCVYIYYIYTYYKCNKNFAMSRTYTWYDSGDEGQGRADLKEKKY